MSGRRMIRLGCDAEGCDEAVVVDVEKLTRARALARGFGWYCVRGHDQCPACHRRTETLLGMVRRRLRDVLGR